MSERLITQLNLYKTANVIDLRGDVLDEFLKYYQSRYHFRPNTTCSYCMGKAIKRVLRDENI